MPPRRVPRLGKWVSTMTRREARENAVGLLFEYAFNAGADAERIYSEACEVRELPDNAFTKSLFFGTLENIEAIDAVVAANLRGWRAERISNVARAILRLGVYEILFCDVPDHVAINEAVELTKKFDDDKARSFVNGVLHSVMKSKTADDEDVKAKGNGADAAADTAENINE